MVSKKMAPVSGVAEISTGSVLSSHYGEATMTVRGGAAISATAPTVATIPSTATRTIAKKTSSTSSGGSKSMSSKATKLVVRLAAADDGRDRHTGAEW